MGGFKGKPRRHIHEGAVTWTDEPEDIGTCPTETTDKFIIDLRRDLPSESSQEMNRLHLSQLLFLQVAV